MQENRSLVGKQVEVKGWVRTVRAQKTVAFLEVNDGSSVGGLQVILNTDAEGYTLVDDGLITTGCSVTATGELVESPGGKQALELKASSLTLIGKKPNNCSL
jgi:asparaginyl-tRNA synthetase